MNKEDLIPKNTIYCYDENGNCPFWACYFDEESWDYIYVCHYLNEFDRKYELSLIWDQCKLCGISEGFEEE